VRNVEECVCSVCLFRCNISIGFRIIKEMPGLVGGGTLHISTVIGTISRSGVCLTTSCLQLTTLPS